MGREKPGDSLAVTNEWGGAWAIPEPEHGQSEMKCFSLSPKLSLTLGKLISSL
jgi:hypothetical protein